MTRPISTAQTVAAGVWTLDPRASTASFTAHQLWFGIPGTIPFRSASVRIGRHGELLDAVAELDLCGIDTGNAHRERDLAKPHLLDTGAYPVLTVDVGPGDRTADGWTAPATIGARGRLCPVQLRISVGERGHAGRLHVAVSTVLDRTPLCIKAPGLVIGRRVDIEVAGVFQQAG